MQLFDRMCMTLGGRAAEAKIFRRVTTGVISDTTVSYCMSVLVPLEIFIKVPEGFRRLRPIRKQPEHAMFLNNGSLWTGYWLVVRRSLGRSFSLLHFVLRYF